MIKQYFQQAWAQLRQQPLISGVTVAGTALSIFLIMLVVMMQQVQVEPFAPESNRDRFLHVKWGSITNEAWGDSNSNGPWSATTLKEIYGKLTTPEQLAEILERGDFLASDNLYRKYSVPMTSLVGKKEFYLFGDTAQMYRLGAALQNVRYDDFSQARSSYSMVFNMNLLSDDWIHADNELCVRVRADRDQNFMENLKADSEKQFRIGNLYISDVRSFKDIRHSFQQGETSEMRNLVVGMGFLLLNIFLGLLGTFWFRTQQRRGEIALHKAMGATDGAVFGRLMSEGLFLLLIVTVPAIIIDIVLAHFELNSWRNGTTLEWPRLAFCVVTTFVLIAAMIGVGIGLPARRAMKVQPAEALHDE